MHRKNTTCKAYHSRCLCCPAFLLLLLSPLLHCLLLLRLLLSYQPLLLGLVPLFLLVLCLLLARLWSSHLKLLLPCLSFLLSHPSLLLQGRDGPGIHLRPHWRKVVKKNRAP